jgi:hydrogenase maturation protease
MAGPLTLTLPMDATGAVDARGAGPDPELRAELSLKADKLPERACRLSLELQNGSALARDVPGTRAEALAKSFVSAHVLFGITGGEFVSLLDPGEVFREAAAACRNVGVFPVLAGEDRTTMLCSPIILYDYPKIAPESTGDFFDGTEMDEMLALRVLTLTDAEKAEMRAGDARGRQILERTEALTNESLLKAHGAIRGMREIRGDAP